MNYVFHSEQLMELFNCRARRRFSRGLKRKPMALIKRLRKAKKEAPPMEKPEVGLRLRSGSVKYIEHDQIFPYMSSCIYMYVFVNSREKKIC